MVLYFNHCSPTSNMYQPGPNRHANQNFLANPYMTYGAAQQAGGQYGVSPGMPDMGPCAGLAAQYQQMTGQMGGGGGGDALHHQQSLGGGPSGSGMPSWHTPSAMYMSPCSRPVTFEDWGAHSALATAAAGGNGSGTCSGLNVGLSASPHGHMQSSAGSSCNFSGGHLYKVGGGGGPSSTGGGTPNSVVGGDVQDYAGHVQVVQDLTNAGGGHHSPDSGLTVSSDGVSSSDSPQHGGGGSVGGGGNGHHHGHPASHVPLHSHHPHHSHLPGHMPPHPHHVQSLNRPTAVRSPFEWMKSKASGYQTQPNPGKTRTKDKYRVVYSDHQRLELEKEFHYSRYITIRRKAELAQMLGLSERQVKIWFQNRRAKERKQGKKREEIKSKDGSSMQGVIGSMSQMQGPPVNMMSTKIINLD